MNFIDTADSYGPEVSETLIADTLYPYADDLVIATKGGLSARARDAGTRTAGPSTCARPARAASAGCGSTRFPLYQLHRPDPKVPFAESVGTLVELKQQGKIRHIGLSNVSEAQLRDAQRLTPVVSVQNRYNPGDRSSDSMVDLCDQETLVFLPWAPIQDTDRLAPVLSAASRHQVSTRQIALAWLLSRSRQILPIPGSGSAEHVTENVAAASVQLTNDEANAILDVA